MSTWYHTGNRVYLFKIHKMLAADGCCLALSCSQRFRTGGGSSAGKKKGCQPETEIQPIAHHVPHQTGIHRHNDMFHESEI
jgi:hypothetical protein